jgi:outer membrane protein OmpA-like peptidoglycan-associated protein
LRILPLSPYRLTIRREAESVTITGHLPDVAARDRLLAALRPRFFRERIIDKTRLAAGAPDSLVRALEVAVPSLATLASGELAVNDRNLGLTGESLYAESARRVAATLPQMMPSGWTAQAGVQARNPIERRDAETCRSQFELDAAARRLRFEPGSSALRPDFYAVLDNFAALAKACPDLRITVTGHVDPAPAPTTPKSPAAEGPPSEPAAIPNTPHPPASKAKEQPKTAKASGKDAGKDQAKTAGKSTKPANAAKSDDQAKDDEPPPDLPRLRALVIVEYLLQAGVAPDQITAVAPEPAAAKRSDVSFALR